MTARSASRAVLLLGLTMTAGGCYAAGAILHTAFGPNAVDAVYELKKQPTLVLVENFQDPDSSSADADTVAHDVSEALHEHASLEVVDADKVVPLRTEQPGTFHEMKIPDVGRSVGAKQVVYVNLVETEHMADPTGVAVHATATANVRVIDATTGAVLWPVGQPRGYEITANMPYDRADSAVGAAMRGDLLNQLSDRIAKLFYSYKPETEQESNGDSKVTTSGI